MKKFLFSRTIVIEVEEIEETEDSEYREMAWDNFTEFIDMDFEDIRDTWSIDDVSGDV